MAHLGQFRADGDNTVVTDGVVVVAVTLAVVVVSAGSDGPTGVLCTGILAVHTVDDIDPGEFKNMFHW